MFEIFVVGKMLSPSYLFGAVPFLQKVMSYLYHFSMDCTSWVSYLISYPKTKVVSTKKAVRILFMFGLSAAGVNKYHLRTICELKAVIQQENTAITK